MFSCSEISMGGVNLEHTLKMSDERSSQYECLWSTNGMNESKSKDRFYSVLYIKFTNDTVQDVFSERQEPCHLGQLLKELAY